MTQNILNSSSAFSLKLEEAARLGALVASGWLDGFTAVVSQSIVVR
jgi:hypothetical protein